MPSRQERFEGCLLGIAMGAALGVHAIPQRWHRDVQDAEGIRRVARELLGTRPTG